MPKPSNPRSALFVICPHRCLRVCAVFLALVWLALSAEAQTTNFALGTTNLLVGSSAGSDSVVLAVTPATGAWTATSNATWLHLSPSNQSGTGSTNLIFSYDANPGATRSGTLTIAGQTLTVTQAGSTYVAAGPLTTLLPEMPFPADTVGPFAAAVDGAGNVYTLFSDYYLGGDCWIDEWKLTNNSLAQIGVAGFSEFPNLINSGAGNILAADGAGNIYIADFGNNAIKERIAANGSVTTLVSSGLSYPIGVAVDTAGNVYIADYGNDAIKEWTAANGSVTTLVSSGLSYPNGVAVDGSGNVYINDIANYAVKEWTAASNTVSTLVSMSGVPPDGVAVDGTGSVYIGGGPNLTLSELPYVFVDPTARSEGAAAGNDSLPVVLPATANLLAPFAPTSDQSWLTITGITNGVVSFSFTANAGSVRTAFITLLGQSILVTQAGLTFTVTHSLGTTARLEGPTAGTDSVVLGVTPATGAWTANANATWLHLDAADQGGTGSTTVVFSYDANPGATRSAALTIGGQTLTVTQAGSTYVAAGTLTALVSSGLRFPDGVAVDGAGNVYIADSYHSAIKEWTPDNNTVSTLVPSGLDSPKLLAVDGAGNVYIADTYNYAIKEWIAAGNTVTTLVSSGLADPNGVAVDGAGNVYIGDSGHSAIKEWTPANNTVNTLVSSGLNYPMGVAVDVAGNVYFSDNNAIGEWTPANNIVTTLVSSVLNNPTGIAVEGAGNVYIADTDNNAIEEWTPANNNLTTLVGGLNAPEAVAVDGVGNVYIADTFNEEIEELPRAFVDPTPRLEGGAAGSDSLPVVLPATDNLLAPFAPVSSQSWLTITGITNGVVSFSFPANTSGSNRSANITLLGQSIAVTQAAPIIGTPPALTAARMLGGGVLQFAFTNTPGASFTVLCSANLSLPLTNWTVAGTATNTTPGQFQFTSQPATNAPQLFYTVRSP
jgi:DNA-binding beta-propeller fold protein YncE